MTTPVPESVSLDFVAASRWPSRAAADLLGIGLVLTVLVALPAAPSDLDRHQLPKETLVHLTTWLAVLLARPRLGDGLSRATRIGLALFLTVSLVSSILATNPWLAFRATALSVSAVVAFATATVLAREGLGPRMLRWCGVAAALGVATALAQAYGAESVLFAATRAPGGTFGNRNFMAHFSALAIPGLIAGTLLTRRTSTAIVAACIVAALMVGIVLSRSRTAWIGSIVGLASYCVALIPAWRARALPVARGRAVLLIAAALAGIGVAIVVPNTLAWRSDSPYAETLAGIANHREGSGRGRVIQYTNTARLAARHPIVGVGPANWAIRYGDVAPPNDPSWAYGDTIPLNPWPSSDWMALLSERGVAGVLALLLVGASSLWRAVRGVRAGGAQGVAAATLGSLLLIAAVEGVFDAVLLLPAPLLIMAISTGALLPAATATEGGHPERHTATRWQVALVALLSVIVVRSSLQTAAYVVAGSGRSLARLNWAAQLDPTSYPIRIAIAMRGSCASARDDALAAFRLAPGWPAPREAMRRCGR